MTHEIVRAHDAHAKAVPWEIEIELRTSTCIVKTYAAGLSTECYCIKILFMWPLPHNKLQ